MTVFVLRITIQQFKLMDQVLSISQKQTFCCCDILFISGTMHSTVAMIEDTEVMSLTFYLGLWGPGGSLQSTVKRIHIFFG